MKNENIHIVLLMPVCSREQQKFFFLLLLFLNCKSNQNICQEKQSGGMFVWLASPTRSELAG